MIAALILLALAVSVNARCDNSCSGHGTCQFDEVCKCFDNWGVGLSIDSGDCSERVCPFEIAWVDTPDEQGTTHKYAECAGKGICNRGTGNCECFEGYEGKGCQRTSCPAGCSGHGTCEYIEDMQYPGELVGTNVGVVADHSTSVVWSDSRATFAYHGWDKSKTRGCVCDAQYHDVDCSKRMCPYGTDVLDTRLDMVSTADHYQTQRLEFVAHTNLTMASLDGQTFAISFRSKLNETFTTIPIVFASTNTGKMCQQMRLALLSLPNKVIDGITCAASAESDARTGGDLDTDTGADISTVFDFTFTGASVQGPQHLMWVESYECANGCTPKITGLDIFAKVTNPNVPVNDPNNPSSGITSGGNNPSDTTEISAADFNSYECGRRGKCDYATGLCGCFAGYTGENCNELTNLV